MEEGILQSNEPLWKHYLLIFREPNGTYSFEFENDFVFVGDRTLVSRLKLTIPQSYILSAGRDQFLKLVRKVFTKMQRPSCVHPENTLLSVRHLIRKLKKRLYKSYSAMCKNLHGIFQYFYEGLQQLIRGLWSPSKTEYVHNLVFRRLQRKDNEILSAQFVS